MVKTILVADQLAAPLIDTIGQQIAALLARHADTPVVKHCRPANNPSFLDGTLRLPAYTIFARGGDFPLVYEDSYASGSRAAMVLVFPLRRRARTIFLLLVTGKTKPRSSY